MHICKKSCTFAARNDIMQFAMCVLEKTTRSITVRLSPRRWSRLMEMEKAYRIAESVVKAKKECETSPAMTVNEALRFIQQL